MAKSNKRDKFPKRSTGNRRRDEYRRDAKDRESESKCPDGKTSSLNDLSWYSRNPNLLVAAGQLPYPYRPGMSFPIATPATTPTKPYAQAAVPGVMSLKWFPTWGQSNSSLDPASIAGKEFYGRVRAAFSGALDADAPDYITYVGALDSVFTYIGWLKRLYRTLTSYTPDNYMLPDGLLKAQGIIFDNASDMLRSAKVLLWQGINELILQSRKFKCPAVMDLFNRHYWMSDNVYADANSTRAQLYLFDVIAVYMIGDVKEASSGDTIKGLVLTPTPTLNPNQSSMNTPGKLVDTLISFGRSMIEALDAWDDGYLISGYLTRAFDGVPSFTVAELMQDELITTSFVPEVLSQIENSKTVIPFGYPYSKPSAQQLAAFTVSQNALTNAVISGSSMAWTLTDITDWSVFYGILPNGFNPMLNIRSDMPTVADNVIASRLHAEKINVTIDATAKKLTADIVAGTEVPYAWEMVTLNPDAIGGTGTIWRTTTIWSELGLYLTSTNVVPVMISDLLSIGQFDWHPFVYILGPNNQVSGGVASNTRASVLGDTFNPTVLTIDVLKNIHKVCMLSELNSFGI